MTSTESAPQIAAGSFRDPQGQVIEFGASVFRALRSPTASFPETWADGGVPLPAALRAIVGLAPRGLIEFVPPDDPMAKRIAGPAERLRHPYDLATFETELSRLADLGHRTYLTSTGRLIIEYSRHT